VRSRASCARDISPSAIERADVERFLAAEVGQLPGAGGDGGVEVAGVGHVEQALDVHVAVRGGRVDVEPARVAAGAALGPLGVELHERGLDGALELRPGQRVCERRQRGIDVSGAGEGEELGGLGDAERAPHLDILVQHPLPHAGQPVRQLHALPEPDAAGGVGPLKRGQQLHHRRLRHRRSTLPGQQHLAVTEARRRHLSGRPRVDDVLVQPRHHRHDLVDLATTAGDRGVAHFGQCRRECGGGHGSIPASTTDTRPRNPALLTGFR
jgi:hypothetical protein